MKLFVIALLAVILLTSALSALGLLMVMLFGRLLRRDQSDRTTPPNKDIWGAAGELPPRSPNKNIWG